MLQIVQEDINLYYRFHIQMSIPILFIATLGMIVSTYNITGLTYYSEPSLVNFIHYSKKNNKFASLY